VAGRLNGVIVDCAVYVEGKRWEGLLSLDAAVSAAHEQEGFVWVEDSVFAANRCNHAERIYRLKREALEFKRAVLPLALAEPVHRLVNVPVQCVAAGLQEYFRDVHDHLLRDGERAESADALLDAALDANLTQVGVQQNEDMSKISAWVAIAAVPTMVAGIHGMNFDNIPASQS